MTERTFPPMEAMARVWVNVWDPDMDDWVRGTQGRELLREAIPLDDFDAGILLDPRSPIADLMPALTAQAVVAFFGTREWLDEKARSKREATHEIVRSHKAAVLQDPEVFGLLGAGYRLAADCSEAAYVCSQAEKALDRQGWKWSEKTRDFTRRDVENAPTHLLSLAISALDRDAMKDWTAKGGDPTDNPVEVRRAIAHCLRWFYPPEKLDTGSDGAIYRRIQYTRTKAKEIKAGR